MRKSDISVANLNASAIEQEIKSRVSVATNVTVLESVGSTNSWLSEQHKNNPAMSLSEVDLLVCATEHQTAGRGRRGKTWHSPSRGVTFSLCFSVPAAVADVGGVSLLTGAAVCDSLRQWSVHSAMIKWPNDILVDNAKLVGILVEVASHSKDETTLIVGIGINYQRGAEQKKIDQESTDLTDLCAGEVPDRSLLIGHVAAAVYRRCNTGSVMDSMADLAREWSRYDAFGEAEITVHRGSDSVLSGRSAGVDETGRLRINTQTGTTLVSSGEVSVRRAW